ncbi:MAG: 16S rRNA processing protein RimM [Bacilli bacterium]|nr:16S rRNA processing protein RimM [Bacilli bacterium]
MEEDYIYIGKIVNTHGIKGELRILSNFKFKEKVFLENRRIYIGDEKIEEIVNSYRHHKIFEMITLKGYDNINQVLKYLNKDVYIKKNDLSLGNKEYLDEELINLNVIFNNELVGHIVAIRQINENNKIIEAIINNKKTLIPYHEDFIGNIDFENKEIELKLIEGMI